MKESGLVFAIVFAREEKDEFNRCSFPIMGRPVVSYPLMAALNAESVDMTFLSTASERIVQEAKAFDNLNTIRRGSECTTIEEEFKKSYKKACEVAGKEPEFVVLLLGNSPCVTGTQIDNAVELLEKSADTDCVATAEKRHFYSTANAFRLNSSTKMLEAHCDEGNDYQYFIDARLMVVRSENLEKLEKPFRLADVYGKNIRPMLQEEGVTDIDYAWQTPLVERWLKNNGFSDKDTPYSKNQPKKDGFKPTYEHPASERKGKVFKVFISTVPFGDIDSYPVDILKAEPNCEYVINPIGRKLKEHELAEILKDYDVLIAGTEPITKKVMDSATNLKLISRVGIGLDSVDLNYAREKGIHVSYTPDAPAPAVAELAICQMLNVSRKVALVDRKLRDGVWQRLMGNRLANLTIGIIGTGRVGSRVLRHLQGFSPKKILVNDIKPDKGLYEVNHAELVSKETIYRESDIITLHVPLTPLTYPLITAREMEKMKKDVVLINTARGGMIDEKDLYEALKEKRIGAAAIDVYMNEPYGGELATLDNCFMTCHMGSCSVDCRFDMEKLATEEAVRFMKGEALQFQAPDYEYEMQKAMK